MLKNGDVVKAGKRHMRVLRRREHTMVEGLMKGQRSRGQSSRENAFLLLLITITVSALHCSGNLPTEVRKKSLGGTTPCRTEKPSQDFDSHPENERK